MANEPPILETFGEITGTKMFQVRGDPQWHSTPALALRAHKSLVKAAEEGFFKRKEKT